MLPIPLPSSTRHVTWANVVAGSVAVQLNGQSRPCLPDGSSAFRTATASLTTTFLILIHRRTHDWSGVALRFAAMSLVLLQATCPALADGHSSGGVNMVIAVGMGVGLGFIALVAVLIVYFQEKKRRAAAQRVKVEPVPIEATIIEIQEPEVAPKKKKKPLKSAPVAKPGAKAAPKPAAKKPLPKSQSQAGAKKPPPKKGRS